MDLPYRSQSHRPRQPRAEYEPPRSHHRNDRGYPAKASPRRSSDARYHDPRYQADDYSNERVGTQDRRGEHRRPVKAVHFREAVHRLIRYLNDGCRAFQDASQEFVREVECIRGYAGTDLVDKIWRAKLNNKPGNRSRNQGGGRNFAEESDTYEGERETSPARTANLRQLAQKIEENLVNTANAAKYASRTTAQNRPDEELARKTLVKKLDTAYHVVGEHIQAALVTEKGVGPLIKELEYVLMALECFQEDGSANHQNHRGDDGGDEYHNEEYETEGGDEESWGG